MAHAGDTQRTSKGGPYIKSTSKAQTSQTFQQLLQREGSKWSHISVQKLKKTNNKEDERNQHNKKSVLAKFKEKAKKLKHSFSKKKLRHENDPPSTSVTRAPIAGSENKREENAEYDSARIPESKHTLNTNKQTPISITEKHSTTSKDEATSSNSTIKDQEAKNQAPPDTSVVAETTNHAPLDVSMVAPDTDAKHQVLTAVDAGTDAKDQAATTADVPREHDSPGIGSKFSNLRVSTKNESERSIKEGENKKGEPKSRDKGVSVKEYLMQKFEPGEDERALSQIITQTISPRRDKVREAMSVFLKNEEPSESASKEVNSSDIDNDTNLNFKSKSLPTSVNKEPKIACIEQSHSLGSKACKNLNETFRSTIASYQNNINSATTSSSPKTSPLSKDSSTRIHSPAKSSSSPLGHSSRANGCKDPVQTNNDATEVPVSSGDQSRVPSQSEINPIRTPLSSAIQAQIPGKRDANGYGTSNDGSSLVYSNNANGTRVPAAKDLIGVVEDGKGGRTFPGNGRSG